MDDAVTLVHFFSNELPTPIIKQLGAERIANPQQFATPAPFSPPAVGIPYRPQFYENTTFQINKVDPDAWWTYQHSDGFPDNAAIEAAHSVADPGEDLGIVNRSTPHAANQGAATSELTTT